jgi:hypothetical protein
VEKMEGTDAHADALKAAEITIVDFDTMMASNLFPSHLP